MLQNSHTNLAAWTLARLQAVRRQILLLVQSADRHPCPSLATISGIKTTKPAFLDRSASKCKDPASNCLPNMADMEFRALQLSGFACPLLCMLLWMSAAQVQVQAQPGGIITSRIYHQFFLHTNDAACSPGFFTYKAFISAASAFPQFATEGDVATRKRELAAFFAQVSKETTGGWPTAPDGPYAWGLCFKREIACDVLCQESPRWPCAPGKSYCGRGPIQLSWNYNYGQAGEALRQPLLAKPELVETDPVLSWKTAIWFWMTPQSPKPSAHSVMVGQWKPSDADRAANRLPGFGLTINIVNGGYECGRGFNVAAQDRIAFYKRYTSILGVSPGGNLDCSNQKSF